MCQLAAAESDLVMVDTWEAAQEDAQRSLVVLQRVQHAVQAHYQSSDGNPNHQQGSKASVHQAKQSLSAPSSNAPSNKPISLQRDVPVATASTSEKSQGAQHQPISKQVEP